MAAETSSKVRHVLFLVADQWRGDALGMLGTPGVLTPHLDALARDSVVFTNHWCQASPCGPSRSSLLTGTHLPRHRQWLNSDQVAHGLETLPNAVRGAGVVPLLIGYTDTPQPPGVGNRDGAFYDPAFELVRPFFWQLGFPAYRTALEAGGYGPLGEDTMAIYPIDGEPTTDGLAPSRVAAADSDVAWLTDAAIDTIRHRPEPWLLHVNWLRPHPPLVPPAPYHRLIHPDEVGLPLKPSALEGQAAAHPFFGLAARGRSMTEYVQQRRRIESIDEADERRIRAAYYGLCAEVDNHIGRLIAELRDAGRYQSTLIVFLSDHGDALGDHWLYGRRGPFDGHFRVPCLIRDPRPQADPTRGTTVEHFTANIDVMPTILDAIDHAVPPTVEGRSLVPFLQGTPPAGWRTHVRYDMDWTDHLGRADRQRVGSDALRFSAIRTKRHRYVAFNSLEPLLYDLVEDPDESTNRADDPSLGDVRRRLAALLSEPTTA